MTNVPVHANATLPVVRDLVSVSTFLSELYVYLLYPMSAVSFCASIYMTLAVTVERYIAVCRPHQYRYISKVIISSLKYKFKYSKTIFISSTSYFIYGLMSQFTPFHLTDNRLWKYNLAMCKDKYYIFLDTLFQNWLTLPGPACCIFSSFSRKYVISSHQPAV